MSEIPVKFYFEPFLITQNELNGLIGTKCQAPYSENWTGATVTHHNALIMSIDAIDDAETLKV